MNEYGSQYGSDDEAGAAPAEAPVPEASAPEAPVSEVAVAEAQPPVAVDATVKDAVSREGEGDVLAQGVSAEGVDSQAITDAASRKIHQEIAQNEGAAAADTVGGIGTIRTETAEAAQDDIATARRNAENNASVAESTQPSASAAEAATPAELQLPGGHPAADFWNDPGAAPPNEGASSMGGYEAQHNDYSALQRQHAASPEAGANSESQLPAGHPAADLWNQPAVAADAPSVQEQFQAAARETTQPAEDAVSTGAETGGSQSVSEQFGPAAREVTERKPAEEEKEEEANLTYDLPKPRPRPRFGPTL